MGEKIVWQVYKDETRVQMFAPVEDFDAADIDLSRHEIEGPWKNKHGVEKVTIRGGAEAMAKTIKKAERYNESLKPVVPESVREWLILDEKRAETFISNMEEWPHGKEFTVHEIRMILGMRQREAKQIVALMFKEKWINSKGHLTDRAYDEAKEWRELGKVTRRKTASPKAKKRKKRGGKG